MIDNEALESFRAECLQAHNQFRALHDVPPMSWSDELAHGAQSWAEKLAEKGFVQYSENQCWGENISMVKLKNNDEKPNGESIVASWYAEVRNYDFGSPRWSKATFHFSQVLWKSSVEFGCGLAKSASSPIAFVVAFYRPSGNNNFRNEYQNNVPPLASEKTLSDSDADGPCDVAAAASTDSRSSANTTPRRLSQQQTQQQSNHNDYLTGSPTPENINHVRDQVDNARDYNSNPSSPLLSSSRFQQPNSPSTQTNNANNKRAQQQQGTISQVVTG